VTTVVVGVAEDEAADAAGVAMVTETVVAGEDVAGEAAVMSAATVLDHHLVEEARAPTIARIIMHPLMLAAAVAAAAAAAVVAASAVYIINIYLYIYIHIYIYIYIYI